MKTTNLTRINDDPTLRGISDLLVAGKEVAVQFSSPIYTEECLRELDGLCYHFGDQLQVRFYGHYSSPFDCSWVRRLPNVANLAVDCLQHAIAVNTLSDLTELETLDLGVYEGVPIDILDSKNFFRLKALSLSESKGRKLDLSPLSKYTNLRTLFVAGQSKGIEAIGTLNSLESLGLSMIGKKTELGFVSNLPILRRLKLLLGGRENIDEIASPSLERLELCRLQGLTAVELGNFPSLTEADIEDQPRLTTLDLTGLERLSRLRVANCPLVSVLSGLSSLRNVKTIHMYRTALDFDRLLSDGLPGTLEKFNFYSMSAKQDGAIREKLASLGLWAKGA